MRSSLVVAAREMPGDRQLEGKVQAMDPFDRTAAIRTPRQLALDFPRNSPRCRPLLEARMRRDSKMDISALLDELSRLRRRAAHQRRKINSNAEAWSIWSATMDEIARATDRIISHPASDPESLAARFYAILWLIEVNQSLLDTSDLRRLRRFGRNLYRLRGGSQATPSPSESRS